MWNISNLFYHKRTIRFYEYLCLLSTYQDINDLIDELTIEVIAGPVPGQAESRPGTVYRITNHTLILLTN